MHAGPLERLGPCRSGLARSAVSGAPSVMDLYLLLFSPETRSLLGPWEAVGIGSFPRKESRALRLKAHSLREGLGFPPPPRPRIFQGPRALPSLSIKHAQAKQRQL